MLADDIKTLRACLHEASAGIDWTSETSVQAHAAINCLENALWHRRTAASFGVAQRSAATAQRVCTGRFAGTRTRVAFASEPAAVITATSIQHRALAKRVPTGMSPASHAVHSLHLEEEKVTVKMCGVHVASSESACSEDSTVPREDLDVDDWLAHSERSSTGIALYEEASCKRVSSDEMTCVLPATSKPEQLHNMFEICDILTCSPTNWRTNESSSEICYAIADILTSGGSSCGSSTPPLVEPLDSLAQRINQFSLVACE